MNEKEIYEMQKEAMKDLNKLNSKLNKLETNYMNDIAKIEDAGISAINELESEFAIAKIEGRSISEPEREIYEWKDTRSNAEKSEENTYENSIRGELLQQIDETRDPLKRKELIEKLNGINDEKLKQQNKKEIMDMVEKKKEDKRKEFIRQYTEEIANRIKDNEARIAEIKIKGEEAVQERNKYLEIKRTIRGISKGEHNKNEVYRATIVEIGKSNKKITDYINEVKKLQKEIILCRAIQRDLDKEYVQNDLIQEEAIIDEQVQEQAQEQNVTESETNETKNNNEEKKEDNEQSTGKEEKMTPLVNQEYMNSLNDAWERAKEEKEFEREAIKAAEEEAKRIEEEEKAKAAEEENKQNIEKENGNVEIEYSAKEDTFFIKNINQDIQDEFSRNDVEKIKDTFMKDALNDENKDKIAEAMIVDKNVEMHYILLKYYDKKYNTNKAEDYLQKTSTMGKSKEQRQKDMDEMSIKISYDLKTFSKDISKEDKRQIISNARDMKKKGIGEVKRGILSSVKDKISTVGNAIKEKGTKLFKTIGHVIATEELDALDEAYGNSKQERKPIVEHVDIDEEKAREAADAKATESVKETEKDKEV